MPDDHKCLYEDRWGSFGEKLDNMHDDIKEVKSLVREQNGRIRKTEIKIAYIYGGMALLGIAIALARWL